jgi:hypothetical protein
MALDRYKLCPCGSGDKVKFCCSKDIVPELEKVLRTVEGEQRVAALDQIDKLVAEKGERLALLALKADLQLSLGGVEGAEQTIAAFQKAAPYNSVALALSAIVAASKSDVEAASEKLQRSLEYVDKEMPESVYAAIGWIGRLMLTHGNVLAARGHWILQANLAGGRDEEPMTLLARLNASPEIPLLLKEDFAYAECPADVRWAGEFNAALKSAGRGAWLAATESLESLAAKVTDHPALVKNMAIFRGWLGETEKAVAAWHKYAAMDGVDRDDAIEAEALAQMLDSKTEGDEVDQITVAFAVPDVEKLMELLLAHKQFSRMSFDLQQLAEEDQPPPKAVFWLLDRPIPETGVGLKREEIPGVVADMMIYGKQTDREARVELVLLKTDGFDDRKQILADLAGELVGEVVEEKKTGSVAVVADALTWRWRLPNDTPLELKKEFLVAQHREVMLEKWTVLPQQVLDGKSPVDASGDDAYGVKLQAIILLLELATDAMDRDFDFDELRTKLGISNRSIISGKDQNVLKLSMVKLNRINSEELEDEQLFMAFQRAVMKNLTALIFRLGQEMLKSDRIPQDLGRSEVYEAVISSCSNSDVALELVAEAKALAVGNNESPARWLMAELSIRLPRIESDQCQRLVETIQSRHINEPGVADGLFRLLVEHGVISPDGMPVGGRPAPQQAAAPSPAAPEASGLWTPDGPATPASDEPQKSKLWVPGMD